MMGALDHARCSGSFFLSAAWVMAWYWRFPTWCSEFDERVYVLLWDGFMDAGLGLSIREAFRVGYRRAARLCGILFIGMNA